MQRTGDDGTLTFASRCAPAADRPYVMRRKLLAIAAAVSLVVCVAISLEWGRSYFVADRLGYTFSGGTRGVRSLGCRSSLGEILLTSLDYEWPPADGWRFETEKPRPTRRTPGWRHFHYGRNAANVYQLFFPHWLPITMFAIPPAFWLAAARRRRNRSRHGLCPSYGYDIRATSDRCPECGSVAAAAA
jgi:hypothetical protein